MKYAIITPTYTEHYIYIDKYLKSFVKYVEDKKDIPIYFIISLNEKETFEKIIGKYRESIDIKILFIEYLFELNKIKETPAEFLEKYGRFTFQTAKKFYSMINIDAEKYFVLDCESMWVRKTNMIKLFEDYFKSPFLVTSKIEKEKRVDYVFNSMLNNIEYILDMPQNTRWFIEHNMWFYEKSILEDLFKQYGTLYSMIQKLALYNHNLKLQNKLKYGIFEIVLYYAFIYKNNNKYKYKHYDINAILEENIPQDILIDYYNKFYEKYQGSTGIIEQYMSLLTEDNWQYFTDVFKKLGLKVVRCQYININQYKPLNNFMDIVQPDILACSQEHIFGINNNPTNKFLMFAPHDKLEKHFYQFIKACCAAFSNLVSSLFYLSKNIFWVIKNLDKLL